MLVYELIFNANSTQDQINQIVNVVSEISDTILKELSDFKVCTSYTTTTPLQ